MYNNIFINLFVLLICFVVVGCGDDDDSANPDSFGITGEWTWVETTGGFIQVTLTPASEMITRKLEIDDEFYREFVNDSLVLETEYELNIDLESFSELLDTIIVFDSGDELALELSGNNLELSEPCDDCFSHKYIKE